MQWRSVFGLMLIVFLVIFCFSAVRAHEFRMRDVQRDATSTARTDANTCIYALAGCGVPMVSLFYVEYAPAGDVPAAELLGKSPEYVQVYTRVYQDELRKKRRRAVLSGSVVSMSLALGVIWLFATRD